MNAPLRFLQHIRSLADAAGLCKRRGSSPHSQRNAVIGSMHEARIAGIREAALATASSGTIHANITQGLCAEIP